MILGRMQSECMSDLNVVLDYIKETFGLDVSVNFKEIIFEGRTLFELFVLECTFQGVKCEELPYEPWTYTLTRLGYASL